MFKTLAITAIVAVAHAANLEWGNAYGTRSYGGYGGGYGQVSGYGGRSYGTVGRYGYAGPLEELLRWLLRLRPSYGVWRLCWLWRLWWLPWLQLLRLDDVDRWIASRTSPAISDEKTER